MENVKPANYVLWAEAQGFVRDPPDYNRVAPRSRALTVAAAKTVKDMLVPLIPAAVLSGRVLNESDDPVPGATVRLYRYSYTRNGVRMESTRSATADDRGEYRIFDVAPGRWYLGVNRYVAPPEPAGRVHSSVIERGYGYAFHPGVERTSEAALIDVVAGAHLAGTDLRLRKARVFHIRGRVLDGRAGQPPPPVRVEADTCSGGDPPFHSVATRRDGSFDLWGMVPSHYCLSAELRSDAGLLRAAQRVILADRDIDSVVLSLEPAIVLRGTATVEGAAPEKLERARVTLARIGGSGESWSSFEPGGGFAVGNLAAGPYWIGVDRTPAGLYLKSLRQGPKDLSADGRIDLEPGAAPLELVIAGGGGEVSGMVSGAGSGLASIAITLAPAGPFAGRRDLLRTVDPEDAAGAFRIEGVAPGSYHLFAWELADTALADWPEFRALLEGRATSVEIHSGERQTVKPNLITAAEVAEARKRLR